MCVSQTCFFASFLSLTYDGVHCPPTFDSERKSCIEQTTLGQEGPAGLTRFTIPPIPVLLCKQNTVQ
jgi:hypothetical protein